MNKFNFYLFIVELLVFYGFFRVYSSWSENITVLYLLNLIIDLKNNDFFLPSTLKKQLKINHTIFYLSTDKYMHY